MTLSMLDIFFEIDVAIVISPISYINFVRSIQIVKLSYRLLYYLVGCLVW